MWDVIHLCFIVEWMLRRESRISDKRDMLCNMYMKKGGKL